MKQDFPLLENKEIVYLDSSATTQKPKVVIDKIKEYYENLNANSSRGAYKLSYNVTELLEQTREKVKKFINANSKDEIIFTKNATESSNLLAYSYGLDNLDENDEVVVSILEHHSNIVPWQFVTKKTKSKLKYLYINEDYIIPKEEIIKNINEKTKIVCITHTSNALGTVNDIEYITEYAHKFGAKVIVDVTQSIPHMQIDVQKINCDFIFFSSHKMLGPLGIGVLYGKQELLEEMNPFNMGGDMIEYVFEDHTKYAKSPDKFEAGTINIEGIIGFNSALEYLEKITYKKIQENDKELFEYAINKLEELDFIKLYIPKNNSHSIISFNVKNIHAHDISTVLDNNNICIRAGHHCAQPLMRYLKIDSTCRISFYIYNTKEDIDKLIESLLEVYNIFSKVINNG